MKVAMMWTATLALAGCAVGVYSPSPLASEAKRMAAPQMECPIENVSAYHAESGNYIARGCGKWDEYSCVVSRDETVCHHVRGPFPDRPASP
jgi:hypothetical protein